MSAIRVVWCGETQERGHITTQDGKHFGKLVHSLFSFIKYCSFSNSFHTYDSWKQRKFRSDCTEKVQIRLHSVQSDLDCLCVPESQPRYNSGGTCLPWWQQGSHSIFGFTFIMITLWLLADHPFCPQLITSYTSEGIVNTVNGYTSHDYDILPLWENSPSQKIRPPLNSIFMFSH